MAEVCSFCHHPVGHPHPCPHEIQTTGGKTPTRIPCPCARPRWATHHIACTDGCASPAECTQPGETPCPCHQEEEPV